MARTPIGTQAPLGAYPATPLAADTADLTFTAGDDVEGMSFAPTGHDLLIVRNVGAGAETLTIKSHASAGSRRRLGDIADYSVGAGEIAMFGPLKVDGWVQSDGLVHVDVSAADVELVIIRL